MPHILRITLTLLLLVTATTAVHAQAPDLGRQIVMPTSTVVPRLSRTTALPAADAGKSEPHAPVNATRQQGADGRQPKGWTTSGELHCDAQSCTPFTVIEKSRSGNDYREGVQSDAPADSSENAAQVTDDGVVTTAPPSALPTVLSTSLPRDFRILAPSNGIPQLPPASFGEPNPPINTNRELSTARSIHPMPMIIGPQTGHSSTRIGRTTPGFQRPSAGVSPVRIGPPPPPRARRSYGGCPLSR